MLKALYGQSYMLFVMTERLCNVHHELLYVSAGRPERTPVFLQQESAKTRCHD